jgi:hypothetical protein
MADDRNRDQENAQDKGKAMGAGAGGSYQGQQERQNAGRSSQPNETAGQGGGMQGTGQHQSNPGGYTEGQGGRDLDQRDKGTATQGRQDKNVE